MQTLLAERIGALQVSFKDAVLPTPAIAVGTSYVNRSDKEDYAISFVGMRKRRRLAAESGALLDFLFALENGVVACYSGEVSEELARSAQLFFI